MIRSALGRDPNGELCPLPLTRAFVESVRGEVGKVNVGRSSWQRDREREREIEWQRDRRGGARIGDEDWYFWASGEMPPPALYGAKNAGAEFAEVYANGEMPPPPVYGANMNGGMGFIEAYPGGPMPPPVLPSFYGPPTNAYVPHFK